MKNNYLVFRDGVCYGQGFRGTREQAMAIEEKMTKQTGEEWNLIKVK